MAKADGRKLGMSNGTAVYRLYRLITFDLLRQAGHNVCYRCGREIECVDELSFDHKVPWRTAPDPIAAYFDLTNVAFSHQRCNSGEPNSRKAHCSKGHAMTEDNTFARGPDRAWRGCRECRRINREQDQHSPTYAERRKKYPSRKSKKSLLA
jgi:hypothetical protein